MRKARLLLIPALAAALLAGCIAAPPGSSAPPVSSPAVSYTHLDVYKRQVQILFSIEKRLLQLCKADEPARKGCCPCRNDPTAARQMLSHLRLPTDVAVAEKQQKDLSQPQNHPACYEEIRPAGRDSPPQEMAADGPATAQIPRCV